MKKLFLDNLATKAMALFLALLTWAYLFAQGQDQVSIKVEFVPPALDTSQFASVTYQTVDGRELKAGSILNVRLSGPKGDISQVRLRAPRTYKCLLPVDPAEMQEPQGTLQVRLEREYFDVPALFSVTAASPTVTIAYVRFREADITLEATKFHREGSPAAGYAVDSITTLPVKIKAKVPENLESGDLTFEIKEVPVEGKQLSFTLENWELAQKAQDLGIMPLEPFRVEVTIVAKPFSKIIPGLALSLTAKPENYSRIELVTKSITIGIKGPEALVTEAAGRSTLFVPYVVVTDADLATAGNKNIAAAQIGCYILDPRYNVLTIEPMADIEKPENRQVQIKILPKPGSQD